MTKVCIICGKDVIKVSKIKPLSRIYMTYQLSQLISRRDGENHMYYNTPIRYICRYVCGSSTEVKWLYMPKLEQKKRKDEHDQMYA